MSCEQRVGSRVRSFCALQRAVRCAVHERKCRGREDERERIRKDEAEGRRGRGGEEELGVHFTNPLLMLERPARAQQARDVSLSTHRIEYSMYGRCVRVSVEEGRVRAKRRVRRVRVRVRSSILRGTSPTVPYRELLNTLLVRMNDVE